MHVFVLYENESSFLALIFRKDGIKIKSYPGKGEEAIFLSYPDFEEYRTIFSKEEEKKKRYTNFS
ncbi:MAG: hypothetical protein EU549_04630 [Promethearchaeota archaeon]|nr:MAG: hypothetical protein EU549_04630 [Candidatus Lokiarchaeota archaeon]